MELIKKKVRTIKTEIFIRNIDDKLFEIKNTKEYCLIVDDCNLLLYINKTGNTKHWFEVEKRKYLLEAFKSNEDAEKVKKYLLNKLKAKADLKLAIQAIKKMKDIPQAFIEEQKLKLRTEYFEFNIIDICNELDIKRGE